MLSTFYISRNYLTFTEIRDMSNFNPTCSSNFQVHLESLQSFLTFCSWSLTAGEEWKQREIKGFLRDENEQVEGCLKELRLKDVVWE